ncbi:MAG: hypothetical protein ABWZ82_01790 [Candidatus Limnocylindrales bacterium]
MPRLPGMPGSRAARRDAAAATTTTFQARSATSAGLAADTESARETVGRQASTIQAPRRERVVERRALVALVALVAGIGGAAAITRAMSDVIETRADVAQARTLNEGIRAQVEAGRREIEFGRSDAYLRFAARSLGYGRGREESFALRDGAAPAPSITPLGAGQAPAETDVLAGFLDILLEP